MKTSTPTPIEPLPSGAKVFSHAEFIRLSPHATIPFRAYPEAAAFDLAACLIDANGRYRTASLGPGTTALISTGLAIRPPRGYVSLVCSRSGLATSGVFVANAPGIVDPDYTGEIKVILVNAGLSPTYVRHGDRIGQLMFVPFIAPELKEVLGFPPSERGDKGFGSSGQ